MAFIKGEKIMVTDNDQEQSVLNDLRLYLFLAGIGISSILVMVAISLFKKYKEKIRVILLK
jgi:hypothetical protein